MGNPFVIFQFFVFFFIAGLKNEALQGYKRRIEISSFLHSSSFIEVVSPAVDMVFKLTVALVTLASLASAANFKRVVCPDGNLTTNEAVRP